MESKENITKTTWILSRRRFCKVNSGAEDCVIEERQRGNCEMTNDPSHSKFIELNDPICAQEKSFEDCDVKIVS